MERELTFDVLKGIGILLVFVAHTFVKGVSPYIMTFHMPLFFIVSGYFYKPKPLVKQIKADSRRLIVPFLFISIITQLLIVFQERYVGHPIIHPDSPAWFLIALFGAKFFYTIICFYFPQHKLIVSFWLSSVPCLLVKCIALSSWIIVSLSCVCAVFFIAIGDCVRQYDILLKLKAHKAITVFFSFLLWLISSIFGGVDLHLCHFKLWFVDFAGACAGTYICYVISASLVNKTLKPFPFLSIIGYYSLIVYSFHAIEYVFPSWYQICSWIRFNPLVLIFVIRISFCCFASWAALKIPFFRLIFLSTRKK